MYYYGRLPLLSTTSLTAPAHAHNHPAPQPYIRGSICRRVVGAERKVGLHQNRVFQRTYGFR